VINCVKQILSTDNQHKNGDQILVTCSENFKLDLAHFLDAHPNPCLRLPFQCCRKLSRTVENRKDRVLDANSSGLSLLIFLKWDGWTWLWFLTAGGHENHLWNLNKIPSLSLVPSSEHSVPGMEQRLHRCVWTWLETAGLDLFFLTFYKNNFILP